MKKRNLLFAALILAVVVALSSCFDDGLHIHVSDNSDECRFRASFDEDLSDDVNRVINHYIRKHNSTSFVYNHTDKEIRFDDGTNFYVKTRPGRLKITINRDENSDASNEDLDAMCEEIKVVLENRDDE